ncbi:MAG: 4Fe-4S binding protein [Paracoccus sp. (in: a-proteobacteria)]|nr:4Fe-4S binding protein [Paracoccus sp. (in: a-proteobacteria)]
MPPPDNDTHILICDCQGTMPLDEAGPALRRACPAGAQATELCRSQLGRFEEMLAETAAEGARLTVACTQEAPLFREVAGEKADLLRFVNIRENAGWSDEAASAGPKMAALLAMASAPQSEFEFVTMESRGIALILAADEAGVALGTKLADTLDITVLLRPGAEVMPRSATVFPVWQGRARAAEGYLSAFRVEVDDFAAPLPSSRGALRFGPARDGAVSQADLILDVSGQSALFPPGLRPGYLRADPRDPAAMARLTDEARGMVGTFDKPRFIDFRADLCAHSRSRQTGCTRCLDVCPAGAIAPDGDTVRIDPMICAGCGQCASVCPTGAAGYALPDAPAVAGQLRAGLAAYHKAAGEADPAPVVLFHDGDHGTPLIAACAHLGPGLPARVIPFELNETTRLAPELIAAAMAYGADVAVLTAARPRHDQGALEAALALCAEIGAAIGRAAPRIIATDDPDALARETRDLPRGPVRQARSGFLPPSDKRGLLVTGMAELLRTAPDAPEELPLAPGAPFGAVIVDPDACVLCHACTGACPTGALLDNPEAPQLRFTESACVQCGLCARICPEDAITLRPRISLPAWDQPRRTLHEEAPFACISCGKGFATASAIEAVKARLAGHWMFAGGGESRLDLLEMCEDCRAAEAVKRGFEPHQSS